MTKSLTSTPERTDISVDISESKDLVVIRISSTEKLTHGKISSILESIVKDLNETEEPENIGS